MSRGLTVLISARDEEEQLPAALAGVSGWASEVVVVVDPRTTDRTREVAAALGARVLEHPFESSAAHSNWGLDRCATDWVLVLDADERVSGELRDAIDRTLEAPACSAYGVRRRNVALGRRLRFGDWGGDVIVRLLDRRRARFVERAVHGAVEAPSVGRVGGALEHHTLRSVSQYVAKLHDYAERGAADLAAADRRSTVPGALLHAGWRFVRAFVLRLGFLDGAPGFVAAALSAYGTLLKRLIAWEAPTRTSPRP